MMGRTFTASLTLEKKAAPFLDTHIKDYIDARGRKAFVMTGADRWGLTRSFLDGGYECTFGDLMFSLGINIPLHTEKQLKTLAALLMPVAGRLPGSSQPIRRRHEHPASLTARPDCVTVRERPRR